jgi:solute carrier family 35 protein E1
MASDETTHPNQTFKFPAFQADLLPTHEEEPPFGFSSSRTASPNRPAQAPQPHNGRAPADTRWQPRKDGGRTQFHIGDRSAYSAYTRHGRQKSLSEALRTIRTRKGSVSQNAHEIADALKAPLSWKLIVRWRGIGTYHND